MLKRTSLVAVMLTACLYGVCWSAEWQIAEQTLTEDVILKAKMLAEERVDVPARAGTFQGTAYIPNAEGDGHILLFLAFNKGIMFEDSEAVAIDTMTGETANFPIPKGLNLHLTLGHGALDAQGRFYCFFRGKGVGQVWRFDPARMSFTELGTPPFKRGHGYIPLTFREGRIWGTVDSDGEVGIYSYDPKAEKFKSYGFVSPKQVRGGETHGYYITAIGDYAYVAVGKVPWRLVAVNLKTGRSEQILEAPAGNCQIWFRDDYVLRRPDPKDSAKKEMYEFRDGKAILADKEWTGTKSIARRKAIAQSRPKPLPRPKVDMTQAVPSGEGKSIVRYRLPGVQEWQTVEVKVKTYPQPIRRLVALPEGRIFGTIGSYNGAFLYDAKTDESERTPVYRLSQYATVVHDGKVYMSGYPSSPVYICDPAKPLRKAIGKGLGDKDANPRLVAYLKASWAHKMWGAAVGSDSKVYFCGEVARQGNGGGFGWWDPKEEKAGALSWKTFAGHKLFNAVAIQNGDKILLSSHTTINNLTGKVSETAKVFVYDVKSGKVIKDFEPIKGAKMIGPMVEVSPGRIMSVANMGRYLQDMDCVLFGLDVNTMEIAFRKKLPVRMLALQQGMRGGQEFIKGPDGHIWTYMGNGFAPRLVTLVRIDPSTAEISVVGRVERRGPMAFVGKDLYRGCEHKAGRLGLRRLTGIVQ